MTQTATNPATEWFERLNVELKELNHEAALYAWDSSTLPTQMATVEKIIQLTKRKAHWERTMCDRGLQHRDFNASLDRAFHLLCRTPQYTDGEISEIAKLLGYMQGIYTETQVCVDDVSNICKQNSEDLLWERTYFQYPDFALKQRSGEKYDEHDKDHICLYGEPEMEQIMTETTSIFSAQINCSINREILHSWAWQSWRLAVGPPMKESYGKLIGHMNIGAQRLGYADIGESWRAELETPNLRELVHRLWRQVKPLYQKLHAVARYFLKRKYPKVENFHPAGLIPAHILGDMWSQNWESLVPLIYPHQVDIEENLKRKNWTGEQLIKRAEDFYSSMGLPMMTKTFWEKSIFARGTNVTKCHGTAANMYDNGDFRMIVCAGNSMSDFYVVMHEMGHIMYYMLASVQPTVFQDGTNSAFQESIGDTIYLSAINPLHLTRINLLNSSFLSPEDEHNLNSFDYVLLLKTAMVKISSIPFSYIMDRYRWALFDGTVDFNAEANNFLWHLLETEQGIKPPTKVDRSEYFDAAAKYHFPDNTPYVRYFLANFLSFQILEGLCRKSIFGSVDSPNELPIPLHRCDLYGSKRAGRLLQKALSLGGSQHWTAVLKILTGSEKISADAMYRYFEPLIELLDKLIQRLDIPVGW
ncbi:angiotensin-converting enzyme-like [Aedes albopictus]|uniref:Angiotensin-converting enzyme n=1 Tax=Aedes albopictus TaxID=7160 RepID=A0ABM1XYL3_AEDAL